MLLYRLPAWQHNSQSSLQENLSFEVSFCYVIFLPLADDVLKMHLGAGPEAGAQVLMWKPWQV